MGPFSLWVCVFILAATYSIEAWSQAMMLTFPPAPPAGGGAPASGPAEGPAIRCSSRRKSCITTTQISGSRRSATCRSIMRARRSRPNRVVYDQKSKRLHAEGNVRLTESDGKVTYGEIMELSDDYRDGFVNSLRLDGAERTRFAAATANAPAAITRCSKTASTPLARRARTIRSGRRAGKSRRRGSFTIIARR